MKETLKDILIGILVIGGFMIGATFIGAVIYNFFGGFWNVFFGL